MAAAIKPRLRSLICFALLVACGVACGTESRNLPSELDVRIAAQSFSTEKSSWSAPVKLGAPVNSPTANDQGPALSSDGLSLYFCSNRLGGSGGNDLWVSRRASKKGTWGTPVNLGPSVNSSAGDCGPSLSADGRLLFFTSNRAGGAGNNDIYMTSRTDRTDDLSWGTPVRLGPEINTAAFEFSPFITKFRGGDDDDEPDDDDDKAAGGAGSVAELYFERGPSNTQTDIFVVKIDRRGNTLGRADQVRELNSDAADGRPTVRFDGREILLHSNRDGRGGNFDLFVATRRSRKHPWSTPVPIDELSSSPMHEIHPYLSRDARTVFFVRGTGQANDIWMAERERRRAP